MMKKGKMTLICKSKKKKKKKMLNLQKIGKLFLNSLITNLKKIKL